MPVFLAFVSTFLAALQVERFRRRRLGEDLWFAAFWASVSVLLVAPHSLLVVLCISLLVAAWTERRQRQQREASGPQATDGLLELPDGPGPVAVPGLDAIGASTPLDSLPRRASELRRWAARHRGVKIGKGPEALDRLDALILECSDEPDPARRRDQAVDFGAALGELLREIDGGEWEIDPEFGLSVVGLRGSQLRAFPMAKARQRLEDPKGSETLRRYYDGLQRMIAESRRQPS